MESGEVSTLGDLNTRLLARCFLVFALASIVAMLVYPRVRGPMISFQIAVREAAPPLSNLIPCFYFDTGHGFSEEEKTCFAYDQNPIKEFHRYRVTLPTFGSVEKLRFDPTQQDGIVAIRDLKLEWYRTAAIALPDALKHSIYPINQTQLSIEDGALVARVQTTDPYFMLADGFDRITGLTATVVLKDCFFAFLFAAALVGLLIILEKIEFRRRALEWFGPLAGPLSPFADPAAKFVQATRAMTVATLAVFLVTLLGTQVFAVLTSVFHYARSVSPVDLGTAPSEAIAIGLMATFATWIIIAGDRSCEGHLWTIPLRVVLVLAQWIVTFVMVILTFFEVLCCYVFWEWGAFVDGSLLRMAYESPAPESLRYYFTRPPAALALLAVIALAVFGVMVFRAFNRRDFPVRLAVGGATLAAVWSLGAWGPLRMPNTYDPSVSSPLVLALRTAPKVSEGLDQAVGVPDYSKFHLPGPRPVPEEYQHYRGVARGKDLIIVVLESVRRANVSLYGYHRDTTPTLRRLADHSMVFSNAYVSQPRSTRTLEAFSLGVYPDPRLETLTWYPERVEGKPSLWNVLAHDGYGEYFSVNAKPTTDGFGPFMEVAMGPALKHSVGVADLLSRFGAAAMPPRSQGNDVIQVDDFLQWYHDRKGPSAAVIWFSGAHHPYWAAHKPFPEHQNIDGYDNCIYSADLAVGHLIDEVEKMGKHPMVLIFGDHGEAFGEHAGDQLHGVYLYNESVRIPMLLYSPEVFPERKDFGGRFSMKDVPETLLYLMGYDQHLGQSQVIFSARPDDLIYMSNLYGDFKLGMVSGPGPEKFMYLPTKKLSYLFNDASDPEERDNLVASRPPEEIRQLQKQVLEWYFYQTHYIDKTYPRSAGATLAATP